MTIQPLAASGAVDPAPVQNPGGVLKRDDFLRLLITQLRNQDPLAPLQQNEFLSQTAQFTSLEELQNIGAAIEQLKLGGAGASLASGAALLGRTARVAGQEFALGGAAPPSLGFALLAPAGAVTVDVSDLQGRLVRRFSLGPSPAGPGAVQWDGLDGEGKRLAPGRYFYRVTAASPFAAGGSVPAVVAEGTVTGVEMRSTGLFYRVGDLLVRQDDIVEVA